jgi:hypothetical protein
MGYTHYYNTKNATDAESYRRGVNDACKIVRASPVPLADGMGDPGTLPETRGALSFNGVGDDSHETLHLAENPTTGFNFCKTARKPYDVVVVAVLATMKDTMGDGFAVSSDGDQSDWEAGCKLASEVLGREIKVPSLEDETTDGKW